MKKIQTFLVAFLLVAMGAFVLIPVSSVGAAGVLDTVCASNPGDSAVCDNKDKTSSDSFVGAIVNTLLFLVGAVSVLSIIIGGILYVTSSGDSGNVTKAKNTILYAIVGLVVAFLAYAIVNWVFKLF
jgi:hypothetical protein